MAQQRSAGSYADIFNISKNGGQGDIINATLLQNFTSEGTDKHGGIDSDMILWIFIDGFLFVSIICGNILTIYVTVMSKTMYRIVSNRFILSLAISDLIVGLMVFYHMMFYIQPEWGNFFGFCMVRLVLVSLACIASAFNILGIAIDRYIAILYPLHYHKIITDKSAKLISFFGWLLAFAVATIPTYWNKWNESEGENTKCEMGNIVHPLYVMTVYLPVYITAHTVMCAFYIKINKETRKHTKRMNHVMNDRQSPWKSIQVLTLVLGSFTISYTPFIIVLVINSVFQRKTRTISTIYKITYSLAVANSAVNPIIYAWKNQDLKRNFCNAIHCKSINSSDELV